MGISEENKNTKNVRLNVLHMRGTEEMSTEDIFEYFEEYAPVSLEWINDFSCKNPLLIICVKFMCEISCKSSCP